MKMDVLVYILLPSDTSCINSTSLNHKRGEGSGRDDFNIKGKINVL